MKIPLVLLTGLLSNNALWKHQASELSEIASIQMISSTQNTPEAMIQAILEAAPPTFALAGHSMGGWLCLEVIRRAPSRVSRLCLLNTTARSDSEEKRKKRLEMIQRTKQGKFKELVEEFIEYFVFNPSVKNDVKKMFLEVGPATFIAQEEAMLARQECLSILPMISCPTLVVHAAKDRIFSLEEQRELSDGVQNGTLTTIENSGHMSPMEKPQEITNLLRSWLTDH